MKRVLHVALPLLLTFTWTGAAHAQIIRPGRVTTPSAYASLGIGWLQQQGVCDPDSGACWNFGSAAQWRAALELPLGSGGSFGVAGTLSHMPLTYDGPALPVVPGTNTCSGCDATANISQIMATLHMGGGTGFHQVVDVDAGVSLFNNFRASDGTSLGPRKTTQDVSFGVGYGFGYGLSPRTAVVLVQEWGLTIHKRQSGTTNNTMQQRVTRIGLRYGLGGR